MQERVGVMGKIRFVTEEFFRSFQKSLIKNILLMVMFLICILMIAIMSSYYLDLGESGKNSDSAVNYGNDGIWYGLSLPLGDSGEYEERLVTMDGSINVMNYYNRVCSIPNHPIMSVNTTQTLLLRESECDPLFQKEDYKKFQPEDMESGVGTEIGGVSDTYMPFKSAQFDVRAYNFFNLKTSKGEGFTADNTTIKNEDEPIPIVLGDLYDGIISLGSQMNIAINGCTDYLFKCKVVGFLERNSKVPDFGYSDQEMISLDSYIIFPYGIKTAYDIKDKKDIAGYAYLNTRALWNSQILLSDSGELREVVELVRNLGNEYDLPPLKLGTASFGLNLLRKESASQIRLMLIITVFLVCFTFFALFMTIYNKIQENRRVYGIYIANGCSISMIVIPFVIELAIILAPSLFVCKWILNEKTLWIYANYGVIIRYIYCLIAGSFVIGVAALRFIIRGINIEQLLKKDY